MQKRLIQKAEDFLSHNEVPVFTNVLRLRSVILKNLPGSIEQVDIPAKMVAFCYGQNMALKQLIVAAFATYKQRILT